MTINASEVSRHSGRRILPKQSVMMQSEPVRVGDAHAHAEAVEIELIREGPVLREIHLKCTCGQTIVLECEYATDVQEA